ncbi:MAG: hypothetical protein LBU32_17725 [Clostridiales bacterium]|nr:hypothetical protein [Clostridiales bacterium]
MSAEAHTCNSLAAALERVPQVLASCGINRPESENIRLSDAKFSAVYIPEKDILEHAKGLLTFIDQKDTDFNSIYTAFHQMFLFWSLIIYRSLNN